MISSPVCQSVRPLCLKDFDSAASASEDTNLVCYVVVGDDVDADADGHVDVYWFVIGLLFCAIGMSRTQLIAWTHAAITQFIS